MHLRESRALGSPLLLIVAAAARSADVDAAWGAVRAAFDDVDRAMSRFRADSELTLLNRRDGRPTQVSRLLWAGLALSDRARRATGGRFDPRIVADLERLGFTAEPQAWATGRPGQEPVLRATPDGRISLSGPVDLGGLGKGIALRRARRAAAARVTGAGFLIDAGGDIVTLGRPRRAMDARRWAIALEDPSGGPEPTVTCELPQGWAIATSSTRRARWIDESGRASHHLVDPRTGEPGGGTLLAVTVAFPDPAWAEVWTKDLFLEGSAGIGPRARGRGLAAWWVDRVDGLSMTPAARQLTTWVRSEGLAPASPRRTSTPIDSGPRSR